MLAFLTLQIGTGQYDARFDPVEPNEKVNQSVLSGSGKKIVGTGFFIKTWIHPTTSDDKASNCSTKPSIILKPSMHTQQVSTSLGWTMLQALMVPTLWKSVISLNVPAVL